MVSLVPSSRLAMASWLAFLYLPCLLNICEAKAKAAPQGGAPAKDVLLAAIITPIRPEGQLRTMHAEKPESIPLGSMFDISCHRRQGNPDNGAGVKWFKNGRPFIDSRSSKIIGWLAGSEGIFRDYQIRFFNFSIADAGRYKCTTPEGDIVAVLSGSVKPLITPFPLAKVVTAGEHFELACDGKGYPQPTTTWELPNGKMRRHNVLRLNATFPKHNGTFTCRSKNSAGESSRKIIVLVKERLRFISQPSMDIVMAQGGFAKLDCTARGYPIPLYRWLAKYQGQSTFAVLGDQTSATLSVSAAQQQSLGEYKCEVTSSFACCPQDNVQPGLSRAFNVHSGQSKADLDCLAVDCSGAPSLTSASHLLFSTLLSLLAVYFVSH